MSKPIRKILGDAFAFVGLSPNGVLLGSQVAKGLQFANEVLQTYNESCLFPFSFATVLGHISGGHAIIANNDDADLKGEVPANISAVFLKVSETDYRELNKCDFKDIFKVRNSGSIPNWYSFMLGGNESGELHFDAIGNYEIMVVYPKRLPELTIDDNFVAPAIYEQVLRYGIAELAAQDAGLEEAAIAPASSRLQNIIRTIKESNGSKRPCKRMMQYSLDRHARFNNPRFI